MSKIRTSVMLDEHILKKAKHRAVERGLSLSQIIEEALSSKGAWPDDGLVEFLAWAEKSRYRSDDGKPLTREEAHER